MRESREYVTNLASLKWMHAQGAEWCAANMPWNYVLRNREGYVPRGDFWASADVLSTAAAYGQLDIIKWLREEIQPPCPWNEEAIEWAGENGRDEVLACLRANGAPEPEEEEEEEDNVW